MANHDSFLTKLKWQTTNKQFNEMTEFGTDCICYVFDKPLSYEEQNDFISFVKDSDNLNQLSPIDFCNYFLRNNIAFQLKYRYVKQLSLMQNYQYYKIIRMIRKQLKNL